MIKREIVFEDDAINVIFNEEMTSAKLGDREYPVTWTDLGGGEYHLRTGTRNYHVVLIEHNSDGGFLFQVNGTLHRAEVRDEKQQLLREMGFEHAETSGKTELKAPMPGKVLEISVAEGAEVAEGESLIILEAMKMENELRAAHPGRIEAIHCKVGHSVEKHEILITITKE